MKTLYPDTATYTNQLRALEDSERKRPKEALAHFLLAYHYLVLGSKDEAVKELKEVSRLVPEDKLSAALVQALRQDSPGGSSSPPPVPRAGGGDKR